MDSARFAKLFDHSIVRPDATRAEVEQFAATAARLGTATLTVQPHYIPLAVAELRGSGVPVGKTVKVITENCYLTDEEKRRACDWIARAGAHFVKTSTAYATGGATLDDVHLMYEAVRGRCQVKVAGGVREIEQVLQYLQAGARRFGSTRTDQFVAAFKNLPADARAGFGEETLWRTSTT